MVYSCYTGCPTRYGTRDFFNHFTTNEDIATKFEAGLPHSVINVKKRTPIPFKFRCNIFIGVRIIKEMPGSVASGTPCIKCINYSFNCKTMCVDVLKLLSRHAG